MSNKVSSIAKGVVAGMAVGATAYMIGSKALGKDKKQFKRNTEKAVKTIGEFTNSISHMMK